MKQLDMRALFLGLQEKMSAELNMIRHQIHHAPTKGQGLENVWIRFLSNHLPRRYSVASAHVVDHRGNCSDAIDIVIYDSQYTPFVLNHEGMSYIPAESVYAVFEAKQCINLPHLRYAGDKIASVRRLERTSAPVIDRGVEKPAPALFTILGGFICLDNEWTTPISVAPGLTGFLREATNDHFIDIGCVLKDRSFIAAPGRLSASGTMTVHFSDADETLIYFFLKLVACLQKLGTVRPIDLNLYIAQLRSGGAV